VIKNRQQFLNRLRVRLGDLPVKNSKAAMFKAVNLVKNEAQQSIMRGSKTGETVKKYNPSRTHTQSAAGEPPASDTGFLASNITTEVEVSGLGADGKVIGSIVSSAPYSKALEYGTVNMPARPFMGPALKKNAGKIRVIFVKQGLIS
jgi:HK97 gp10 family phage protein